MSITKKIFGTTQSGAQVFNFTLCNLNGMSVELSEYGASIVKLIVPDKNGHKIDVVGGYDFLSSYELADGYQGAVVGRFANRIAKGRFCLDGVYYQLSLNERKNHLHGGESGGIGHKVWHSEILNNGEEPSVRFYCVSPDGEDGYPGTLSIDVTYTLKSSNTLALRYNAISDKKTIVNLTNHAYFNLGGYSSGRIHEHILTLNADRYIETDNELIPTGNIISVENTPFDFRTPKKIGRDIGANDKDIKLAGGYDHCFVFPDNKDKREVVERAALFCEASGIELKLLTNQPAVHIYSGNFMNNKKFPLKNECPQIPQTTLCMETERIPDSINHSNFTDCILCEGDKYDYTTEFVFGIRN